MIMKKLCKVANNSSDREYHNCQANTAHVNSRTTHDADTPTPNQRPADGATKHWAWP